MSNITGVKVVWQHCLWCSKQIWSYRNLQTLFDMSSSGAFVFLLLCHSLQFVLIVPLTVGFCSFFCLLFLSQLPSFQLCCGFLSLCLLHILDAVSFLLFKLRPNKTHFIYKFQYIWQVIFLDACWCYMSRLRCRCYLHHSLQRIFFLCMLFLCLGPGLCRKFLLVFQKSSFSDLLLFFFIIWNTCIQTVVQYLVLYYYL